MSDIHPFNGVNSFAPRQATAGTGAGWATSTEAVRLRIELSSERDSPAPLELDASGQIVTRNVGNKWSEVDFDVTQVLVNIKDAMRHVQPLTQQAGVGTP